MSLTKKRKVAVTKVDKNKVYSLKDASALVKEINCTKFDSSVDLHPNGYEDLQNYQTWYN